MTDADDLDIWELRHGDTLIGTLTVTDDDMPWYSATFDSTSEYAAYHPVFEEGNRLRTADDPDAWAAWQQKVLGLGLRLIRLRDQAIVGDFIVYIDGREADFRPRFDSMNPTAKG